MRTIEEIATDLAEGLEPWLAHDEACVCANDSVIHVPMCGNCSCGLRDSLMAEAIGSIATDEEVLAYAAENGEGVELEAELVREILRAAWQRFKESQSVDAVEPHTVSNTGNPSTRDGESS
jgi:hypothetical protein